MSNQNITNHAELVALFNKGTTRELHLHLERDCGTNSVPFYISTADKRLAKGVMHTETNNDGEYIDELAWAVLDDCYDGFTSVTEYDSLVSGRTPSTRA